MSFNCSCCHKKNLPATCFEIFKGVQRKTCLACKATRAKSYLKKTATRTTVPTEWTKHVKQFADQNTISYANAVSDSECKIAYQRIKALKKQASFIQAIHIYNLESGETVISENPRCMRSLTEEEYLLENNAVILRLYQVNVAPTIMKFLNRYMTADDQYMQCMLKRAMSDLRDIVLKDKTAIFSIESVQQAIKKMRGDAKHKFILKLKRDYVLTIKNGSTQGSI
jgi:hypothetical protein